MCSPPCEFFSEAEAPHSYRVGGHTDPSVSVANTERLPLAICTALLRFASQYDTNSVLT